MASPELVPERVSISNSHAPPDQLNYRPALSHHLCPEGAAYHIDESEMEPYGAGAYNPRFISGCSLFKAQLIFRLNFVVQQVIALT